MSTTSIPKTQQEFEEDIQDLLAGLNERAPHEMHEGVVAKHILEASKDKVEGQIARTSDIQATFLNRTFEVTKAGSAFVDIFGGTCVDAWDSAHTGVVASITKPDKARFLALDGQVVPNLLCQNCIIIAFYDAQERKCAVFVGASNNHHNHFITGEGRFHDAF
ncbi:hypothetical protein C8Q73DRAFT_835068 [Cubamyces lactineus]|nr:hypothetical protein C8Q73DRAFT_835068 [Cubamyces lactineus]